MIGETVSHYRIIERLGAGGMGTVYLAEDTVLGRRVAIKTLTDLGPGSQHFRTRFLREARAVSALSHPHIATIHDYGETPNGQPYIVMEFIKGETLADLMHKEVLTIPRSLEIVSEVAEALGEAHSHGIIHRDIKPSNIAINHRGEVKVLDFGLAKQIEPGFADSINGEHQTLLNTQTREGVIVGTPMYLSPEQALGVDVDRRSDLFSLGAVLYECLAGKPPFIGGSAVEICAKVIRDDPAPPSQSNANVSKELDQIALKALAKKQDARYQNADELISDLNEARAEAAGFHQTITRAINMAPGTHPTGALATLSDIFKRPRLSVGYVIAGLILLSLVGFSFWHFNQIKPHQPTTEAQEFYQEGVEALHEGSYHKARKMFERASFADDQFGLAHARLAETLTELDYLDRAKDELLIANRLIIDPSTLEQLDELYFDAISSTVMRDLGSAIESYEEIARVKPNAHAYLDLGRAYENNDETDKALANYNKALELDGNNAAALLRTAVLQGRKQDLAAASSAFSRADGIYKDSQNFEGHSEVAYQYGYLLSQASKMPEALEQAQKSFDISKLADNKYQQVRAMLLIGTVAYSSGDTTKAHQIVQQAINLARDNEMDNLATQGLADLGYALMIKRSYEESESYLNQALEWAQRYKAKRNEARAKLLLGTLFTQREEADRAAPFIDQALTFYRTGSYRREVSRCMMMRGRQQLLKGDFDGAVKTLDEQIQLARKVEDPGQLARSQAEVAAALSKQDLYPQALVRYTESYELNKHLKNPLNTAFALLNRADMLARLGHYEESNAALDELVPYLDLLSSDTVYKNIWSAWGYLIRGRMALSERRFDEARRYCELALKVLSEKDQNASAEVNSTIGLIEVLSGDRKSGLKRSERALATATSVKNERLIANLQLTVAEAHLEAGDELAALTASTQAQEGLAKFRQDEMLWRAWLIGALANGRLGNTDKMRDQIFSANAVLGRLKTKWGIDSFQTYSSRSDIKNYLTLLNRLAE